MTESKPLLCPFCGTPLEREDILGGGAFWRHGRREGQTAWIDCFLEVEGSLMFWDTPANIAAWNSRAPWTVTRERLDAILNEQHGTLVAALGGKVVDQ